MQGCARILTHVYSGLYFNNRLYIRKWLMQNDYVFIIKISYIDLFIYIYILKYNY